MNDYPPVAHNTLLVDFDGTIKPWGDLFADPATVWPIRGSDKFIYEMNKKGYKIGIFTSRLSDVWLEDENQNKQKHIDYVTAYCDYWEIPFHFITAEKVPAMQYFDDKATNVHDNWDEILEEWNAIPVLA